MRSALGLLLACQLLVVVSAYTSEGPTKTIESRGVVVDSVNSLLPYNVLTPGPTPLFVLPAKPNTLPVEQVATLLTVTTATSTSVLYKSAQSLLANAATLNVGGILKTVSSLVPNLLCGLFGCPTPNPYDLLKAAGASNCLDSRYNDTTIYNLFLYGGAGTTVNLCPGAVINLVKPIFFTAANQKLQTYGGANVLASQRATVRVTGADQSCAIFSANCDKGCDGVTLSNIIVHGNRDGLGRIADGIGLIEMGGNNKGQTVTGIRAYEPRGWTALHAIEGNNNTCSGFVATNSQFGPCGHGPSGPDQYRRMIKAKRDTGVHYPGEWADGISLACRDSTVTNNVITDATDGGIVVFQAPGSTISGNTIVADQRQLLGGINAVDYFPFGGGYTGVKITKNTLDAKNSMIKIGLAIGPLSWGDEGVNSTSYRTFDGTWSSNTFTSTGPGYFGFGITVAGHNSSTVQSNQFLGANFGGVNTNRCFSPIPPMGPMYRNQWTTPNANLQSGFVNGDKFSFMICNGPGAITRPAVTQLA